LKNKLQKLQRVEEEVADVFIYCLSMTNALDIDLSKAVMNKLEKNDRKYPVDLYKGKADLSS